MSPDRLAELRRQRALVAQHLAWIDSELTAAGTGQAPPAAVAAPAAQPSPAPVSTAGVATSETAPAIASTDDLDPSLALANARADEIIEKYRATEALDPREAKRGCLVLIGAFFILGAVTLLAIYYFGYSQK